ncbi:MAG: ThiF family adenylyltransferase, partial [Lachnospiraceae bacterium]|nr:ThiF family adenylyltransferase [Lachnospiraceae bacterium]
SCFRCVTDLMNTNRKTYALCTIANNPRIPEHCIEYAFVSEWSKHHKNPVDKDSIEDVNWIYQTALARAKEFNIEGVTYNLTLGVIKNIIPAIASTNALIAASTVMECLKIWSGMSKRLDNYFMYMGQEGIYALNQKYEKIANCKTCSKHVHTLKVDENETWKNVIGKMIQLTDIKPVTNSFSIYYNNSQIYDSNSERQISEINENKTVEELREEYKDTAAENVRADLVLDAVAEAEGVQVTPDDMNREIFIMAQNFGADPKEVWDIIAKEGRVSMLAGSVARKKAARFIVDNAKGAEKAE